LIFPEDQIEKINNQISNTFKNILDELHIKFLEEVDKKGGVKLDINQLELIRQVFDFLKNNI
jgi:hypothetical protein